MKIYFYPCTLDYFLSDNSEKKYLKCSRKKSDSWFYCELVEK